MRVPLGSTLRKSETSDDDYIDPEMDKYFKLDKKSTKSGKTDSLKKNDNQDAEEASESEDEQEEIEEEEIEEEESDDDQSGNEASDVEKEENSDDEEAEEGDDARIQLTMKMIEKWSEKLLDEKPFNTINEVVKAFKSAILNVVPRKKSVRTAYRVDGSELFNAMVRLCIRDLLPCLLRVLSLNQQAKAKTDANANKIKPASSGTNWKKLKSPVKSYLADMLSLASNINEPDILNAILRHLRLLINFYMCFPKMLKDLIKLLITVWSEHDEKSRVIAFVCLHRIVSNPHEKNQDFIFKNLYIAFVRNSKFTSINTLPMINFMQRSLVELYGTNTKLAYEHVFVYIRQLAIHLRNAMNFKKKESYQAVYNWQYIHSLVLWSKLLSVLSNSSRDVHSNLQPLIYPLIQCLIGTLKLIPTPRYYPLRFHCVNALILISNSTNVFIPVIPFILEVFDITDFNKKHATISVKQLNFSFILKLNKQQLNDKSFKDVLIDIIYDNLILYLQNQSHDISFPELALPLTIRLKDFVKKCKNGNYVKVVKGLVDKIQENSKCIEERRSKVNFSIRDKKQVEIWIEKNKEQGTPLITWYSRYKTLREREIMMEISNKDNISKNNIQVEKPQVERPTSQQKLEERKEFGELFVNLEDDDESDTELIDFMPKMKNEDEKMEADSGSESEDNFSDIDGQESEEEE